MVGHCQPEGWVIRAPSFHSTALGLGRGKALLLICILSLSACGTPAQRAQVEEEHALSRSSDRFWQHIAENRESDWFKLLNTPDEAQRWRLAMIDSAHKSIDLETFLWKPDQVGARILAHLLAAADRGVKVRILLDDSFTEHEDLALYYLDLHHNIELRLYNPYHARVDSMAGRTLFNLGDFARVNHRMHNKALIVDDWAVTVGGRNLADEYFGLHVTHNFRDMEVLTMGDSANAVTQHFDAFWNSGWSFPIDQVVEAPNEAAGMKSLQDFLGDSAVQVHILDESELENLWKAAADRAVMGRAQFHSDKPAHSDPKLNGEQPNQLAKFLDETIASAQSEVILVTAYLVPTAELLAALADAEQRGVRVRILTNSMRSNNHLAAHAAYAGYIRDLLELGAELHEVRVDAQDRDIYMQAPSENKKLGLHAKFMIVDTDRVFIGSSNLDPRSLKLNTELGLMIESAELNTRLRSAITVDFEPRNSWSVQIQQGELVWVGVDETFHQTPADSVFQQLEDWFIGLLPIDAQM